MVDSTGNRIIACNREPDTVKPQYNKVINHGDHTNEMLFVGKHSIGECSTAVVGPMGGYFWGILQMGDWTRYNEASLVTKCNVWTLTSSKVLVRRVKCLHLPRGVSHLHWSCNPVAVISPIYISFIFVIFIKSIEMKLHLQIVYLFL